MQLRAAAPMLPHLVPGYDDVAREGSASVIREQRMHTRRWTVRSLCLLATAAAAMPAAAQDYPTRPVRIISDSAPGSAIDAIARVVTERLSRNWGQPVTIANLPGAGGSIAASAAAKAAPDGHTLFLAALSTFMAPRGTATNLPIMVPRDFVPVGHFGGAPMFITAASSLNVKTLPEFITLAKKKRPNELTYATTGPGRLTHMAGELLAHRAGIELLMIPYPGGPQQALKEAESRRVSLVIEAYSGLASAIEARLVVPLAVASAKRIPGFPNLPTVAETLPGFEAAGWQAVLAPLGTPDAIVRKVNADLIRTFDDPDIRKRLAGYYREQPALSPAETAAFIHAQQATWAPILKQIGSK
jgi:tripartite-type tricarboxylate transporter receptor subunit TctC